MIRKHQNQDHYSNNNGSKWLTSDKFRNRWSSREPVAKNNMANDEPWDSSPKNWKSNNSKGKDNYNSWEKEP